MALVPIDDPDDPRIVPYTGLTDEQLRRHREGPGGDLSGIFICEGTRVTERAMAAGLHPLSVLSASDMTERVPDMPEDVPVYVGSPEVVEAVTGVRFHRGFVAAFRRPTPMEPAQVLAHAKRVVVCENVTDPTNVGVVIRSAAGLGMDALLIDPTTCDPFYRRVLRVSMGAVFGFPHARLDRLPGGLEVVSDHGFRLVGLSPDPQAAPIGGLEPAPKTALILGAEGPGLSEATIRQLDRLVRIPMRPNIDSLNIGAAAAIAAYVVGGLER
ncbi:MAG TPA: RNA methyltransferase [Acidimicrobiia bacterium]|nr:RNA methyltransferase [Acidimicrobiia bacterium]